MFKSKGNLASKIAHTSLIPLGNQDLRHLQELINNEKTLLNSLQRLSTDYLRVADSLRAYGAEEGDDLNDILGKSSMIMGQVATAITQLGTHENAVRGHMKAIRTREENLTELKARRKNVGTKAEAAEKKLSKMSGEHKSLSQQTELLNRLREEMRQLDIDILTEEAGVSDFKRTTSKHLLALKFGGLLEFAEKSTIVGELGKAMIEEIPIQPTPPGQPRVAYQGYDRTNQLVREVERCVGEVVFNVAPEAVHVNPAYITGRGSEDGAPSMMASSLGPPTHDRFGTVGSGNSYNAPHSPTSYRADNSDYAPSPIVQEMVRPNEFGEEPHYGGMPASAPGSVMNRESLTPGGPGGGGSQFGTYPSNAHAQPKHDRHVTFTQSVQDAFERSPNLSAINLSSGPPLDLSLTPGGTGPASPPQSPQRAAPLQANPWDAPPAGPPPPPGPERRASWALLPEDERARNHAAAADIGKSIFAPQPPVPPVLHGQEQTPQRQGSLPPPPPQPAWMPALRTPSPSTMPQRISEEMYADANAAPVNSLLPHSPLSGPGQGPHGMAPIPKPPSLYSTPVHTPQVEQRPPLSPAGSTASSGGGGRITAAAFRRGGAVRSPTSSVSDLRRPSGAYMASDEGHAGGVPPPRQGTLPPYDPQMQQAAAYADAYDGYDAGTGSPTERDYGAIGAARVANMHSSDTSGYAQGRYATNLDN